MSSTDDRYNNRRLGRYDGPVPLPCTADRLSVRVGSIYSGYAVWPAGYWSGVFWAVAFSITRFLRSISVLRSVLRRLSHKTAPNCLARLGKMPRRQTFVHCITPSVNVTIRKHANFRNTDRPQGLPESGLESHQKREKGIEPSPPAWKAGALPLSYSREQQT